MSRSIPAGDYVDHFDPELPHHRAWLLAVLEGLVAHEPKALEEGIPLRSLRTLIRAGVELHRMPWLTTPVPSWLLSPWTRRSWVPASRSSQLSSQWGRPPGRPRAMAWPQAAAALGPLNQPITQLQRFPAALAAPERA